MGEFPPQIRIPKNASYLAHCHELDHAEFDAGYGKREMTYYMLHPGVWADMERHAYGIEIAQAEQYGYTELADRLRTNLAKEVHYIEEKYGNSQ